MRHENAFRRRLSDGDRVLGARVASFAPAFVEMYGSLGLDFAWIDFEHGEGYPAAGARLPHLVRAAEAADVQLLVRIPAETDLIRRVLDTGVRNLLVPRVEGAEEVRRVVGASRFSHGDSPGKRGFAGGRSSGYGTVPDYPAREDESVCVGVMIETRSAVEELDSILGVPDLGFAFVGRMDLSVEYGHPGDPSHPAVQGAIADIETACLDAGVPLGGVGHDPGTARDLLDAGYQVVRMGGDFGATRELLRQRLDRLEGTDGGESAPSG